MSNSPRRWLDEDASPSVRALLESAQSDEPTRDQLAGLTSKIAFLFPIPPGSGPGGGSGPGDAGAGDAGAGDAGAGGAGSAGSGAAAAGAAAKVGATAAVGGAKLIASAVSALVVGAVAATVALSRPNRVQPEESRRAPIAEVVTYSHDAGAVEVAQPSEPPPPIAPPSAAPPRVPVRAVTPPVALVEVQTPPPPPPPAPAPQEDAELMLLQKAMSASQSGDASGALAHALAHADQFPGSAMAQEREVIAVEALVTLGRNDEAKQRVAAFRAKWPTSTHLLRLERLAIP